MANFLPLIEYFGIGAFLVWIYFLEKGDRATHDEGKRAQRSIDTITEYYQISWVFFGIAVLAEYALTEEWLTSVFGSGSLIFANYISIIFGLIMFAVPSRTIYRKIKEHKSYAALTPLDVGDVFFAALYALINIAMLYGVAVNQPFGLGNRIFVSSFAVSFIGIGAQLKWRKTKGWKSRIIQVTAFLPWIMLMVWIIAVYVLSLFGFSF